MGGFTEFDVEFKFAKIQNSYVEGRWVGWFTEFDVEFKFAKIQNSYVEGGWVGGGGFTEFDVEFKFAKIQNSYVEGGFGGGGVSQNLMLSSNLLKSKIPMLRAGGWVGWGGGGFTEFDVEFKFAKIQNSYVEGGGGGFAEFDVEFKFAKIQSFYFHEPPPPENGNFSSGLDLGNYLKLTFRNSFQVPE